MQNQTIINLGPAPSVSEVAALFKLHPSVIYRHLYAGNLEVIKGFGRARVCPKSIERFLSKTGIHKAGKTRGRRGGRKGRSSESSNIHNHLRPSRVSHVNAEALR